MGINNNAKLFAPGTVLNQNLFGTSMSLQTVFNFSIQIFFSGTPTGIFFLEGSNDSYVIGTPTSSNQPTHWSMIAGSQLTVSAGGDVMWDYQMSGFSWVRAIYQDNSGGTSTATITSATFNGK